MSKPARFYACEQGAEQSVESFANEIHAAWLELRLIRADGENYNMRVDVEERKTELAGNFIWRLHHHEMKRELKLWFESFEWGRKPGFAQAKQKALEFEDRLNDDIPDFDSDPDA